MLLDHLFQRLALANDPGIKLFDQSGVSFERPRRTVHVQSVEIAVGQQYIELLDQFGILHPSQLFTLQVIGQLFAVPDRRDHAVIDESGIRIQFFGGRQFFAAPEFDPVFGVIRHVYDEPQQLMVKLVGLIDAEQQIFFRNDQGVRLRLKMRIKSFDNLNP